jgi:glycine dehydrogenase subunit 1
MSLLGETGLRKLAALNHANARKLRDAVATVPGVKVLTPRFFNEIAVELPRDANEVVDVLAGEGILAGVPYARLDPEAGLDKVLLLAATETTQPADIETLVRGLSRVLAA